MNRKIRFRQHPTLVETQLLWRVYGTCYRSRLVVTFFFCFFFKLLSLYFFYYVSSVFEPIKQTSLYKHHIVCVAPRLGV